MNVIWWQDLFYTILIGSIAALVALLVGSVFVGAWKAWRGKP